MHGDVRGSALKVTHRIATLRHQLSNQAVGLAHYAGGIVDEVNGKKIRTLDELAKALAESPERLVIRMIGDGPPLVLNRSQVEAARERIKARYNVVKEQNLQERPESAESRQANKS